MTEGSQVGATPIEEGMPQNLGGHYGRVAEVAQVIADGGRRPGPKARAEGSLENVGLFGSHIDAFSKEEFKTWRAPSAHCPGGRLRRMHPLSRRAPSAH